MQSELEGAIATHAVQARGPRVIGVATAARQSGGIGHCYDDDYEKDLLEPKQEVLEHQQLTTVTAEGLGRTEKARGG